MNKPDDPIQIPNFVGRISHYSEGFFMREGTDMGYRINQHLPKYVGLFLVLILWVGVPAMAQSQVVGNGYNNSLIYKIQSDTNTVYLLGSIHVLAEEYYPLTRAFSYAYYNSQKVIFEIDPEILFSSATSKKIAKHYTFSNGKTLKTVLSRNTYALLKKKLDAMGIGMEEVKKFKPWVVNKIVGSSLFSARDFRPDLGIENYFYRMAKDAEKPTAGLETIEDQLNIDDKLPLKMQEAILRDTLSISNSKEVKKAFLHLVKSWHQGNFNELENIIDTQKKKNPKYHHALLTNRNKKWMPQIEAFLQEDKNVLVIVGAAHLVGEDGLITLLTEKGYELERVSYARP